MTKVNYNFLLRVKKSCIDGMAVYTVDGNFMARCSTTKTVYRIDKINDLKSLLFFFSKQHQTQPRMPLMLNDLLYFVLVYFTICYR